MAFSYPIARRRTPKPLLVARTSILAVLALAVAGSLSAQPFGAWGIYSRPQQGFLQIPHHPSLNPTAAITIEGWVNVTDGGGCSNIIGKGYQSAWWVGICGTNLRSYLRGSGSARTAGELPSGWNHFAVTFDGTTRRHYVNGVLVGSWMEPGALTSNSNPVRIGSDVNFNGSSPNGAINEIRLWNVARTTQQLRETINVSLHAPQSHLIASWNGLGNDQVGAQDATVVGSVPALTFPVTTLPCTNSPTNICLHSRFDVHATWQTTSDEGPAMRAPLTTVQSGIFWFFNAINWEVMLKVIDGCSFNNRYWVFSAATTNVAYRLEVFDREAGANKVYFNYAGPPAPAVTDTQAFATCP